MVWYDIFVSFIGAFLGFAFALAGDAIVGLYSDRRNLNKFMKNIRDELIGIQRDLEKYQNSPNVVLHFDVPIWESFLQSGLIKLLISRSYYSLILYVYAKIKVANETEKTNSDAQTLISRRTEILVKIKELLSDKSFDKMK